MILLSGVAFLIFGLSRSSDSLQKLAANQIRKVLNRARETGIIAVVIGAGLTLLMQSSGAVTATLVNLGSARVLSLPQVMAVLIGSAIGATLTVQLISLHLTDWGLPLFVVGFLVHYTSRKRLVRDWFAFIMSIGLIFFGIELIGLAARTLLADVPLFGQAIEHVRQHPVLAFILSAGLTSVFQSSTATIGIVMAFAASGVLSVSDSIIWVFGANIGSTSTALLASLRGDYVGKRIAWANTLYRVATVVAFVPFSGVALALLEANFSAPTAQIAFFYTAMNLFSASIFFPLRKYGVKIVETLVQPSPAEREFGVRFLKRSTYESFPIALAHAKREILEMGDIVMTMTESSIGLFKRNDPDLYHEIKKDDDKVDLLLKEIKLFLIRVSERTPEGLSQSVIELVSFGSDLEAAADIIDHQVTSLAKKLDRKQMQFSDDDIQDLDSLHKNVVRAISLALGSFQTDDHKLMEQVVQFRRELRDQENGYREAHIARLNKGIQNGIGSSAIYLECLASYLQIVEIVSKHAHRTCNQLGARVDAVPKA